MFELCDLVDMYSGGTPSRSNATLWGGMIPWVSGKDMKSFRLSGSIERITELAVNSGSRCVGSGSILILVRGMALFKGVPIGILTCKASFNQDVKALVPHAGIDPTFLGYAIAARENFLQSFVTSAGHGTGRLITEALQTLPIWVPLIPEQQRIASVLDEWDDAISGCEKLIVALERRLEWMRSNVLGGMTRLSGYSAPWKTIAIAEILTEHGDSSTGKEEVYSVSVHLGLVNQIKHLGRSFAAASTKHYNRVRPGDIVYTKSPTGEFPLGIIKQSKVDDAVIVSPLYGVFKPASRAMGTILDELMASPSAAKRLLAPVVQKGAKNTIAVTNRDFLQAKLFLPTDEKEIEALCDLVEAAQTELKVHRDELNLLRREKRGLMQKLLTGDWRVPEGVDHLMPNSEVTKKFAKEALA